MSPNPGAVPATWNRPSSAAGIGLAAGFHTGSSTPRAKYRPSGPVVTVASRRLLPEIVRRLVSITKTVAPTTGWPEGSVARPDTSIVSMCDSSLPTGFRFGAGAGLPSFALAVVPAFAATALEGASSRAIGRGPLATATIPSAISPTTISPTAAIFN